MLKLIKKTLIILSILLAIVYMLGCLLPWLSPKYFWILGFIGFSFPYISIVLLLVTIIWLFFKPKLSLLLFIVFCCGYKQITVAFAFNKNTVFNKAKPVNSIRVISFNAANLSRKTQEKHATKHTAEEFVSFITAQNADVICLQEFAETRDIKKPKEYIDLCKKYKYVFIPFWRVGPYCHKSGNIIFSKYPIINVDSTDFESGANIIRADIAINTDTVSFFVTHFDSFKFSKNEFEEIDGDNYVDQESVKQSWRSILNKVQQELNIHNNEATIANKFIQTTSYPFVFCVDMNEVPNNYVYWKIRNNKQDAFLQSGFGLGKTFNSLSAFLRIDYIMPSHHFTVKQFNIIDEGLSDHKMLVADISKQ